MSKNRKRGLQQMLIPTIIMGVLAIVFIFLAYQRGGTPHVIVGLKGAGNMLLQIVPLLIFSFIVAGIIPLLFPQEAISRWVGVESGWRGILTGTVVGGLLPGGPYILLPMMAGLLRVGASVGTMVAMLFGWELLALPRLPLEVGILGWKFTLIRFACGFFFPPIAGLIANLLFSRVNIT